MHYIDLGNSFANTTETPCIVTIGDRSVLVKTWGVANAHKIAAQLTMAADASGWPMAIDSMMVTLNEENDKMTRQQKSFQVEVISCRQAVPA